MSPLNSADQAVDFLLAVALGAASGLFYCFLCALRRVGKNGHLAVFMQDIVFWVSQAVATFCFLLLRCHGQLRGYVFLGILAGFALFRLLIHRFCLKALIWLVNFSAKLFWPIRALLAALGKFFSSCAEKICETAKKEAKKFQKAKKRLESRE